MGSLNVIASEQDETETAQDFEGGESPFAWEVRVMLVSAFWMLPGVLFGILLRLCVPDGGPVVFWLAGGGVLGAIAGGMLEADHWTG
jgi:hypothetical protein